MNTTILMVTFGICGVLAVWALLEHANDVSRYLYDTETGEVEGWVLE